MARHSMGVISAASTEAGIKASSAAVANGHGAALLGDLRRRQGGREISSYDSRPERNCCLAHPTSKGVKNTTSITIAAIIQSPSTRR